LLTNKLKKNKFASTLLFNQQIYLSTRLENKKLNNKRNKYLFFLIYFGGKEGYLYENSFDIPCLLKVVMIGLICLRMKEHLRRNIYSKVLFCLLLIHGWIAMLISKINKATGIWFCIKM
jgi:hypothetical protein